MRMFLFLIQRKMKFHNQFLFDSLDLEKSIPIARLIFHSLGILLDWSIKINLVLGFPNFSESRHIFQLKFVHGALFFIIYWW